MFSRFSVSSIIVLIAVIWGVSLWVLGVELTWEHAKPFSITVSVVTLMLTGFERFLWRIPPVSWFCPVPNLSGTWTVVLQSSYYDPATQMKVDPVIGSAMIRQTFSSLSIRISTGSQSSFLIAQNIIKHGDGAVEIIGVYQSDPDIHLRGKSSEIHYGAFRYSVAGTPPNEIRGAYWTDRNTNGSIHMARET
ncbi:hypothetical protein [Rhizobium leguminosarum]|uniref:Cap15 family cyclic dinucleotide receptor domain-containing protein n=1 Tax=Rhizobium leguminosarum TaxID=384 RepID=UPI0039657990